MKRKVYCCDASRRLYEDYYANQSGGTMPVFVGRRHQRGHGLAQTIGGLFKRFVVPLVAPHAKRIGKQILGNVAKTGMEVVGDVMEGRSVKEAVKERGLSGIKRTVGDIIHQSPFNNTDRSTLPPAKKPKSNLNPIPKPKKSKKARKKTKSGRKRDIFA